MAAIRREDAAWPLAGHLIDEGVIEVLDALGGVDGAVVCRTRRDFDGNLRVIDPVIETGGVNVGGGAEVFELLGDTGDLRGQLTEANQLPVDIERLVPLAEARLGTVRLADAPYLVLVVRFPSYRNASCAVTQSLRMYVLGTDRVKFF